MVCQNWEPFLRLAFGMIPAAAWAWQHSMSGWCPQLGPGWPAGFCVFQIPAYQSRRPQQDSWMLPRSVWPECSASGHHRANGAHGNYNVCCPGVDQIADTLVANQGSIAVFVQFHTGMLKTTSEYGKVGTTVDCMTGGTSAV